MALGVPQGGLWAWPAVLWLLWPLGSQQSAPCVLCHMGRMSIAGGPTGLQVPVPWASSPRPALLARSLRCAISFLLSQCFWGFWLPPWSLPTCTGFWRRVSFLKILVWALQGSWLPWLPRTSQHRNVALALGNSAPGTMVCGCAVLGCGCCAGDPAPPAAAVASALWRGVPALAAVPGSLAAGARRGRISSLCSRSNCSDADLGQLPSLSRHGNESRRLKDKWLIKKQCCIAGFFIPPTAASAEAAPLALALPSPGEGAVRQLGTVPKLIMCLITCPSHRTACPQHPRAWSGAAALVLALGHHGLVLGKAHAGTELGRCSQHRGARTPALLPSSWAARCSQQPGYTLLTPLPFAILQLVFVLQDFKNLTPCRISSSGWLVPAPHSRCR